MLLAAILLSAILSDAGVPVGDPLRLGQVPLWNLIVYRCQVLHAVVRFDTAAPHDVPRPGLVGAGVVHGEGVVPPQRPERGGPPKPAVPAHAATQGGSISLLLNHEPVGPAIET
jgi:hypothetical protein